MHTQKLLALLTTAAMLGSGLSLAQSSDSDNSSTPRRSTRLTPEAEAKAREEMRRQIAILDAQSGAGKSPSGASSIPTSPVPASSAPAGSSSVKVLPGRVVELQSGWLGGKSNVSYQAPAENIPLTAPLTPEARQKVLDALHKAEADLDAKDGIPGDKLSPEDDQKLRETLRQAEADLNARDKAAVDRVAQQKAAAEMAAKQAREAKLAAEKAAAESMKNQKESEMTAEQKAAAGKAAAELAAKKKAEAERAALRQSVAKQQNPNSADLYTPSAGIMVPGSKEQRLYDLLQLYKSDKISPAEYHQQRAKIVAEP